MALCDVAATPTRMPRSQQVDREPRAGPGLARPGRALDHQDAAVEPAHLRLQAVEIERLVVERRRARAQPRRAAQQQVGAGVEAAARLDADVGDPIREAEERVDLGVGGVGPPRAEGERRVVALRAGAGHHRDAGGLVELERAPSRRSASGSSRLPGPSLYSCSGNRIRHVMRLSSIVSLDHLEVRERLGVLVAQLRQRLARAGRRAPSRRAWPRGCGSRAGRRSCARRAARRCPRTRRREGPAAAAAAWPRAARGRRRAWRSAAWVARAAARRASMPYCASASGRRSSSQRYSARVAAQSSSL